MWHCMCCRHFRYRPGSIAAAQPGGPHLYELCNVYSPAAIGIHLNEGLEDRAVLCSDRLPELVLQPVQLLLVLDVIPAATACHSGGGAIS